MENWVKVINNNLQFSVQTKVTPTKGNLVYEYNPFRNYRLSEDMYEYKNSYHTLEQLKDKYGIYIQDNSWFNSQGAILDYTKEVPVLREKGELVDFITDQLQLSINNPVHIIPQHSYDGSVNLIINDGVNIPRLINSRFSATGKNTYEIVDRKGNNDTNIYDQGDQFDIDTSLYKRVIEIPKIQFSGTFSGGNLKVGNYYFYFKLADADGNETDFVGESGLVSVFVGETGPISSHTGTKNENSYKQVKFIISNIDSSYNYVTVYYSRSSSELNDNSIIQYVKINKKFTVNNIQEAIVTITGFEEEQAIDSTNINLSYNVIDSAVTSATCQNMLFLANVHKQDIPYNTLEQLALRFLPYVKEANYPLQMNHNYVITSVNKGYYDPKFIYNNTGYWGEEIYRIGIVFILPNGELTPVFNIRGKYGIKQFNETKAKTFIEQNPDNRFNDGQYNHFFLKEKDSQNIIPINSDNDNFIINPNELEGIKVSSTYENSKGVITFSPDQDVDKIYALDIRVDDDTIQELKKYVKGYFFVRQTRIPTVLAQGVTIGLDKVSHTPTIPTCGGFLHEMAESLDGSTYVETNDINDVNYISEGFLTRYQFSLTSASSGIWKKLGKIIATAMVAATVIAGTVITCGGAAVATALASLTISSSFYVAAGAAVAASAVVTGATAGIVGATIGIADEIRYAVARAIGKKKLNGRNTNIPSGYKRKEKDDSRKISEDFRDRVIIKDSTSNKIQAIICPDYEVNQEYFNQIFTGGTFVIETAVMQSVNNLSGYSSNYFSNEENHFYFPSYYNSSGKQSNLAKIIAVPDNVKLLGLESNKYRSRAGDAEEAFRYEQVGTKFDSSQDQKINSDIIRGSFGPYLGISDYPDYPCQLVNIMIPGYNVNNIREYFKIRMEDKSSFYSISDRYSIKEQDNNLVTQTDNIKIDGIQSKSRKGGYRYELYRGDCYLCQFTHRVNRNFNDPSAPFNDEIVDGNTWRDNYDPDNTEKYEQINLGDVNAVQLGMWVTFKIRSSNNLNIRTLDQSNVDEAAMVGHPRGYYPYHPMSTDGTNKHPESQLYNKGFSRSVGDRWNFELPDVPYIKNWFGTRIMYSDIHVNDAYKNGFRVFQGAHYRDYTREYGEIVKLISLESNLLCVFEHGVALIPVNERAVAGEGAGGNVYINTSNVLPENPKIISDMFGSQWPESILKVPGKTGDSAQYVYGVDTVAKKIWRTDGNTLTCISDFRVQEFLNKNITLGERELTPKIGIRNVKTVYNAFKRDVLFTFYDNTYGFEEKVWNLCWNELLQKFITFYSWVPSYMENINNIPFSFNRDTSKWIAKLGTSHTESSFADGVTVSNVILENTENENGEVVTNFRFPLYYLNKQGEWVTQKCIVDEDSRGKFIGVLSLSNRVLPDSQLHYQVSYSLERDQYGNYKKFDIVQLSADAMGGTFLPDDAMFAGAFVPIYALKFKEGGDEYSPIYYKEGQELVQVSDGQGNTFYTYEAIYTPEALLSELYYRNSAGNSYADYDVHKLGPRNTSTSMTYSPGEWFKDIETMYDIIDRYSPETLVGNSTGYDSNGKPLTELNPCTTVGEIASLVWYQTVNGERKAMVHGIPLNWHWILEDPTIDISKNKIHLDLPIFKDITGKRPTLPREEMINPDKLVTLLNIKATISIVDSDNSNKLSDEYYNMKAGFQQGTSLVDAGYYESVVAITPRWNLQFLSTDFWKHGQAGLIDIADDIYPTYWYGKQHPFEFECVIVNDPSMHKIFTNLEIVANKAKPESFHYEIIGESYDFAKDKVNMYFRQEAMKALWQYNGADISYDRNFLKVQPRQQPKSADFPHKYYTRQDTINEIEDYYIHVTYPESHDYRHLSGAEVVYYPNRQEYRIWNHAMAVSLDDLSQDDSRSIIAANCQYLEDRWKVTINPILVCYKNEYQNKFSGPLIQPKNSTWASAKNSSQLLPPFSIYNSPIPDQVLAAGSIDFPGNDSGQDNALYNLYDLSRYGNGSWSPLDLTNWLDDVNVYKYNFGEAQNRRELDVKDKFLKVRIRYSGEELAIIDFLNTVYRISYS